MLHCRQADFLDLRTHCDPARLYALDAEADLDLLGRYCVAYTRIAYGDATAGPIALLPPSERFHWLTATRSTILQPSPLHGGRTADPAATLEHLFAQHVLDD